MRNCLFFILSFCCWLYISCSEETYNMIQQESELSSNIIITNGKISSPIWMVKKIDSIKSMYQNNLDDLLITPSVLEISNNGKLFYNIINPVAQNEQDISSYYSLDGQIIQPATSLYYELKNNEHKKVILADILDSFYSGIETRNNITQVTYVYTPKGSPVPRCWETSEGLTDESKELRELEVQTAYPEAIIRSSATDTYNCHSYAWFRQSDNNNVWVGSPEIYWQDHSYEEVESLDSADKIVYFRNGHISHSAVTTSNSGVVISKWDDGPLVEHEWDNCKYYNDLTTVKYYARNYRPNYYISSHSEVFPAHEYTTYASNNYSSITMYAFAPYSSPTRYEWTALGGDGSERWYAYPNGSRIELSVYLPMNGCCTIVLKCDMYAGIQFLGTAENVIHIMQSNLEMNNIDNSEEEVEE